MELREANLIFDSDKLKAAYNIEIGDVIRINRKDEILYVKVVGIPKELTIECKPACESDMWKYRFKHLIDRIDSAEEVIEPDGYIFSLYDFDEEDNKTFKYFYKELKEELEGLKNLCELDDGKLEDIREDGRIFDEYGELIKVLMNYMIENYL